MAFAFYVAGAIAILSTALALTRLEVVHALLYLVVSLLAVAVVFYALGAPFVAALEVIVYAGAIMVLFVFVMMMLNLGERAATLERAWLSPGAWTGPSLLGAILVGELAYLLLAGGAQPASAAVVGPEQVGLTLFGPYLLGVELASMLLLGGLVGAFHVGREAWHNLAGAYDHDSSAARAAAGRDAVRPGPGGPARSA